jgi:hypothetical protein
MKLILEGLYLVVTDSTAFCTTIGLYSFKEEVMNKRNWNQPAPASVLEKPAAIAPPREPQPIEAVVAETKRLLESQGWCLWRCSTLGDAVIVVVRDELMTGYPAGYPVYLAQELDELGGAGADTMRRIHEAKKLAGAVIIS